MSLLADDVPVEVRANLVPAEIVVSSSLAEDTVIANPMEIAPGQNKQAMLANPFTGGAEEILFVDHVGALWWARHVNPEGQGETAAGDPVGWRQDLVTTGASEVVVAVHPTGAVFAFVLVGSGPGVELVSFQLVADPTVPGGLRWSQETWLAAAPLVGLQVYYCTDRPASPFVFVRRSDLPRVTWISPRYAAQGGGKLWHQGGQFDYDEQDRGRPAVFGVDSPLELGNAPVVAVVRMWSLFGNMLCLTSHYTANGGYERVMVPRSHLWKELLGAWAHPAGVGVVGVNEIGGEIELALAVDTIPMVIKVPFLDRPLQEMVVWQDADNYLHVYGRDEAATLCAVHQTGWDTGDLYGRVVPVWDSHESPVPGGGQSLTTRPLVGQVDRYAVDAFPDFTPNQHVMHQGVPPGEACAIYTQSVRTSFWCVEKMRMVDPAALPKPYTVPRYQTSLTVKNAFGAPIGGVGVQISADVPVDLEVAGTFYRTGAVSPVTLVTDVRGQVTLRVVAAGLTVPDLYVTVPGLDQSATIQMAADVHKFLAGNATLPNHPDGFTAKVVEKATIPGSTTKLFPHLAPTGSQGTWPPQAADVVTWCQGAFAVDTGQPLPTAMTAGLAEGEQVLAFTIQTHDPTRSGFEVYTNSDQINAREASLDALDGFITEAEDWLGDVWQGIRHGVTEVSEVLVDLADSTIELVITLVDGVINRLKVAWDDILSAAHAVEAVFVAIGAKIQEALQWLKWAFDFKDAFLTAKALEGVYRQIPDLTKPALEDLKKLASGWFVAREGDVTGFFEDMKGKILPGKTVGSIETPLAGTPTNVPLPPTGQSTDPLQSPHTGWLTEKVFGVEASSIEVSLPTEDGIFEDLWKLVTTSSAWPDLQQAWEDVGKLWTNLFDAADAQTAIAQELVTILDLLEHVVNALLKFLDDVVHGFIDLAERGLEGMVALFDSPLIVESSLLSTLWGFMVNSAGLDPKDHPLTMGSLAMLLAAYPTTLVYKMITGSTPFPDGVVTGFGTSAGQLRKEPASAIYVLNGQQFAGIISSFMAAFDITLNSLCLSGPTARLTPGTQFKCVLPWGLMSCLRFFGPLMSTPQMWGYDMTLESAKEKVLWATFGVDMGYAVLNQGFSFILRSPLERLLTWETEKPYNLFGISVSSAYGLARLISSIFEWRSSPMTWFSTQETAANALRWVPQATGFVRYLYDTSPTPATGTAVIAKMVADVGFDVFYGGLRTAHATYERNHLPTISGTDPLVLKAATATHPYDSDAIEVAGGIPAYWWDAVKTGTETGLPPGLLIERVSWPADLGRQVKVTGTTQESGRFTFSLRVHDGYVPSVAGTRKCELIVYGMPTAGFTPNPSTGPAPLTVAFTDTSSGIPTAWSWDFGNGKTSTEQNPSEVFEAPGVYGVTLTVSNPAGTSTPVVQKVTVT